MSLFHELETMALHAGHAPDAEHGSRAVPVHLTTSYLFRDARHAAALYNMEEGGHLYSRISNPTVAVLEQRVAAMEGGAAAIATASGMAALHCVATMLASAGDHIVSTAQLYGANINLLKNTLPRFGVETSFVHGRDLAGLTAAIRPNTKFIFCEMIGNPGLDVVDVTALSQIAREAGLPLVMDATFCTPVSVQAGGAWRQRRHPLADQMDGRTRRCDRRRGGRWRQFRLGPVGPLADADASPSTRSTGWCSGRSSGR